MTRRMRQKRRDSAGVISVRTVVRLSSASTLDTADHEPLSRNDRVSKLRQVPGAEEKVLPD